MTSDYDIKYEKEKVEKIKAETEKQRVLSSRPESVQLAQKDLEKYNSGVICLVTIILCTIFAVVLIGRTYNIDVTEIIRIFSGG